MKGLRPPELDLELTQPAGKSGLLWEKIGEERHSYQLSIYGLECTNRLIKSDVLVSGMQGLGCEIAKHLIIAGVKSVTVHDENDVTLWDLSSCFVFSEGDLGKNKALSSVTKLQEINKSVLVSAKTTMLVKEDLRHFQAVVFTNITLEKAIEFDIFCRQQQPAIAFIRSDVRGLFGSVFCDFGPKFTVFDVYGEDLYTGYVGIVKSKPMVIYLCHPSPNQLGLKVGDHIIFSQVRNMPGLCDGRPRKLKDIRDDTLFLEEDIEKHARNCSVIMPCGFVKKVESKELNFEPLQQALNNPRNFSKHDRSLLHHLAFQALDKFIVELQRLPFAGSEEDSEKLIAQAIHINNGLPADGKVDIDHKLLRNFAFGARAVLSPMATMFGGIVGQEVLKACSGKYHPLFQFFYFDSIESLPSESLDSEDLKPMNSRYDPQISVFGSKLQQKLEESKIFIVGCGTLGCEFLKNAALMGVCICDSGKLTITDAGVVERGSLDRQFTFLDQNIDQPKSIVAVSAALSMNSQLKVEALQHRACPDTEDVLDNTFWESVTVVINALDDVEERFSVDYISKRALYYKKALLDAGTLVSKCNTRTIIPDLTDCSGASVDPLKNYDYQRSVYERPLNIDHCLSWAKSQFDGLFDKAVKEANRYLSNPNEYIAALRHGIDAKYILHDLLVCIEDCLACKTFHDCLTWARRKYNQYFVHDVMLIRLMHYDEASFSSVRPIIYNHDCITVDFVKTMAILRAKSFGIVIPSWVDRGHVMLEDTNDVAAPTNEANKDTIFRFTTAHTVDDVTLVNNLVNKLEQSRTKFPLGFRMNPIRFDKETEQHMELIHSLAGFRARNFDIEEFNVRRAQYFFRETIPPMVASRLIASGLACLELYKVIDGKHKRESYRNYCVDIAVPSVSPSQPLPPPVTQFKNQNFTVWDRLEMKGDPTLELLIDFLLGIGLTVDTVAFGHHRVIYSRLKGEHEVRLNRRLSDLVMQFARTELNRDRHFDVVVCCEEVIVPPPISIYFNN